MTEVGVEAEEDGGGSTVGMEASQMSESARGHHGNQRREKRHTDVQRFKTAILKRRRILELPGFPSEQKVHENLREWRILATKAKMGYSSADYIEHQPLGQLLSSGCIALVKGSYIEQMANSDPPQPLQRRQEMELQDLVASYWQPEEALELWQKYEATFFIAVSHPWITADHPDPQCFHSTRLAKIIVAWKQRWGIAQRWGVHRNGGLPDVGVFYDFSSIFQGKCSEKRRDQRKGAMERLELIYGHALTTVFNITSLPADAGALEADRRGWLLFEQSVAEFKENAKEKVYTFDQDFSPSTNVNWEEAARVRGAPIVPTRRWKPEVQEVKSFARELQDRQFMIRSTDEFNVLLWYQGFFTARAKCQVLSFDKLNWSMAQFRQFLCVLLHCGNLEELSLQDNRWLEDEHTHLLTKVLPRLRRLKKLTLTGGSISDQAYDRLRAQCTIQNISHLP